MRTWGGCSERGPPTAAFKRTPAAGGRGGAGRGGAEQAVPLLAVAGSSPPRCQVPQAPVSTSPVAPPASSVLEDLSCTL